MRDLCAVDLNREAACAEDFRIEVSAGGRGRTTLESVTGATGARASYEVSGSGGHVRVLGTARGA
ncbi:hypothetical protein AB0420_01685 [Streptomyces caelestis]|uniref:hypothetical protein n=1 Tax=Streptomyces caelestis TaxID=36816 RepID=UPI003450546C